jgi:hypothetical protein
MMKENKENYLDRIPCRTSRFRWSQDEDGFVTIHIEHRGFFDRVAQNLFDRPRVSHVDLDAFGSVLWLNIDGKKTVGELADVMENHFGEKAHPLYERLIVFMQMLARQEFITWRKE